MSTEKNPVNLEHLANAVPGALYQLQRSPDGELKFNYISQGVKAIYGCSAEELANDISLLSHIIHPDDLQSVLTSMHESAHYQYLWVKEYRVLRNGREAWIYGHAVTIRQEDGSTLWNGQMLDITERKMLELKVEENQRNLILAERVAGLGHWQLDLETGQSLWSETMYDLHELNKATAKPSLALAMERTHPEDREKVYAAIEAVKQSGARDVEHRIILGDGEVRWLRSSGIYRVDDAGREIIFGTSQDITDYKELELKLRQTGGSDEYTGFYNRRLMLQSLQRRFSLFQAHAEYRYYVLVLQVADDAETLTKVSQIVRKSIQDYDIPGYLGNGLIVVLMSTLSAEQNNECLSAIRQQLIKGNLDHKVALECAQVTDLRFDDILIRAMR
ncbi:PAS domain-containing protein [Idiomarina sp. HP20-50]|uniref:PAS domain-containing protein n=1 Tax=Idiomarina sp. HP20-50 TaxID=3070813 RepID=UPI00294B639A|nr:PAS domain-containing protein [Idiomarina sp. HP20-50]MDV6316724.1 PAS domain-containing protein [Idiomarina sp. HP20-50]